MIFFKFKQTFLEKLNKCSVKLSLSFFLMKRNHKKISTKIQTQTIQIPTILILENIQKIIVNKLKHILKR